MNLRQHLQTENELSDLDIGNSGKMGKGSAAVSFTGVA